MPTQNTKFVMSHAQPTGLLRPQTPTPRMNSQAIIRNMTPVRPAVAKKARYQARGVFRSRTMSETFSVIVVKSLPPRMSSTGLVGSSRVLSQASEPCGVIIQAPVRLAERS